MRQMASAIANVKQTPSKLLPVCFTNRPNHAATRYVAPGGATDREMPVIDSLTPDGSPARPPVQHFLLPHPADQAELNQVIERLALVIDAWAGKATLTPTDHVFGMHSLAAMAGALSSTLTETQVESTADVMEATIGVSETLDAFRGIVSAYVTMMESKPEWFRKPHRDSPQRGGQPGLPPEVESRRRMANDAEVAQFLAQTSGIYKLLLEQIDIAINLSEHARRSADRFCHPDTLWGLCKPETPTALYFWYDADNVLLYIGITGDLATRQSSHVKRSSWSEFADHSKIRRFPSRSEAERAEKAAIEAERPLFNHVHNDTPEARARLVAYLIEHGRMDLLAPAVSRG